MLDTMISLRDKIKDSESRVLMAYAFSKIPWVHEPEIGIVNSKPTAYKKGYVMPTDFYAAIHTSASPLSLKELKEVYFSHRSGIQGTCGIDAEDKKRVSLTIFPEDVNFPFGGDFISFHYDADESIRNKLQLSLYSIYDELLSHRESRRSAL